MSRQLIDNNCRRCGKWAGAHATLPGQPTDHLCKCPTLADLVSRSVAPDNFALMPAARFPGLATRAALEDQIEQQAAEIERLRADLKAAQGFGELWYFVMDEAPMKFESIVCNYSPARWLDEAAKLRADMSTREGA